MEEKQEQYGRTSGARNISENDPEGSESKNTQEKSVAVPDPSSHTRDVNSRRIFKNAKLTCQFLKDYSGIPIFKNLRPEDIEDVTSKYQAYLGVEFEADTVKRIRVQKDDKEQEIYVIPLIEHKSHVDYNIQMQILRYMSVIWYDYGKQKNADEMSLVMMFNKIQSPKDYEEFLKTSEAFMEAVLKNTPQELLQILQEVFWALLMKMNVSKDEAEELMDQMEARNVGYLFENAEKMDIQAERRKTEEERKRADTAERRADTLEAEVLNVTEEKNELEDSVTGFIKTLTGLCKKDNLTKDETKERLRNLYKIKETYLSSFFEKIWNDTI